MYNRNDDLKYCLMCNKPAKFIEADIVKIVAEVPGQNDEYNWHWILKLKNRKYAYLVAWCDYTGWDCKSGIKIEEITNTALQAAKLAPVVEEWSNRKIRVNLIAQIKGQQPSGLYNPDLVI